METLGFFAEIIWSILLATRLDPTTEVGVKAFDGLMCSPLQQSYNSIWVLSRQLSCNFRVCAASNNRGRCKSATDQNIN